jgi:hypothetical protein
MSLIKQFVNSDSQSLDFQYAVPTVSVTTFSIAASSSNIWMILTATGTLSVELIFPPASSAFEGQEITITTSQEITGITLSGNGASIVGEPVGIGAGGSATFRFEPVTTTWYCIALVNELLP